MRYLFQYFSTMVTFTSFLKMTEPQVKDELIEEEENPETVTKMKVLNTKIDRLNHTVETMWKYFDARFQRITPQNNDPQIQKLNKPSGNDSNVDIDSLSSDKHFNDQTLKERLKSYSSCTADDKVIIVKTIDDLHDEIQSIDKLYSDETSTLQSQIEALKKQVEQNWKCVEPHARMIQSLNSQVLLKHKDALFRIDDLDGVIAHNFKHWTKETTNLSKRIDGLETVLRIIHKTLNEQKEQGDSYIAEALEYIRTNKTINLKNLDERTNIIEKRANTIEERITQLEELIQEKTKSTWYQSGGFNK